MQTELFNQVKLFSGTRSCLWEAMRRLLIGQDKTLDSPFLGLGYPGEYKQAVKSGIFEPSFRKETPRILSWYKLTPVGKQIVQALQKSGTHPQSCQDVSGHVPDKILLPG